MLTGDAHNTVKDSPSQKSANVGFFCTSPTHSGSSVLPICNPNSTMGYKIGFPNCWNGKDLDSPDHRSHMAYKVRLPKTRTLECPATHPHLMPTILFSFKYKVDDPDGTKSWRLSSDTDMSLPAFITAHGDWAMGMDQGVQKMLIENCLKPIKDCGAHLLGNGKRLVPRQVNLRARLLSKFKDEKVSSVNVGNKLN
jgi:hypothetical protein